MQLKGKLKSKIQLFKKMALEMPIIGEADTPIFFIPVGNPDAAFTIGRKLMDQGFYQSLSVFPSVPFQNAGLRYTITNAIEDIDIENVLTKLSVERKKTLEHMSICEEKIMRSFKGVSFSGKSFENV